ncbi:MAG: peptidoglycan-binding domain-containing protein, partial [Methylocella sp.]
PSAIEDGPRLEPGAKGPDVLALQAMLASYGYGLDLTGLYDAVTLSAVTAFQRHFRQARVDGIADYSTISTLRRLTASLAKS